VYGDSSTAATLFGRIAKLDATLGALDSGSIVALIQQLQSSDLSTIKQALNGVATVLGSTTDTLASDTLYGKINTIYTDVDEIKTDIGDPTDLYTNTSTVFGNLANVTKIANQIDGNAADALSTVKAIRIELGAQGNPESVGQGVRNVEGLLGEIKKLSDSLVQQGNENKGLAEKMINQLVDATNNTMQQLGFVGEKVEKISGSVQGDSQQIQQIQAKLEEMRAYLQMIQEALKVSAAPKEGGKEMQRAVVKAWMELEQK
jgi:methyl-accepting chemotaxis protein